MSELISGKEALITLANGKDVECRNNITGSDWDNAKCLSVESFFNPTLMWSFRFKPKTITLNGIEVPAPFIPEDGDEVYFIDCETSRGYSSDFVGHGCEENWIQFGAWRTEDEVKQVITALRKIFSNT